MSRTFHHGTGVPSRVRHALRRKDRAVRRHAMQRGDYDAAVVLSRDVARNVSIINY